MNKHATDVVSYLTWVGLLVACVAGDRAASRFHLNQSLVIWLAATLCGIAAKLVGWIPVVGWIVKAALWIVEALCAVCWLIGLIDAIRDVEKPVPVLGKIRLL